MNYSMMIGAKNNDIAKIIIERSDERVYVVWRM